LCDCIEAVRCQRCGLCTYCTHERAWFGFEKPVRRRFYNPIETSVNPGWNVVEVTEYWVHYHPYNGCWKILAHEGV
jgi:hypothetical protein